MLTFVQTYEILTGHMYLVLTKCQVLFFMPTYLLKQSHEMSNIIILVFFFQMRRPRHREAK